MGGPAGVAVSGENGSQICVEVSTGWTASAAPRDVDAAATAEVPDMRRWLTALDQQGADGRRGLHGRTLTQFVAGEPVEIIEESGDWVRVVAPWQPSPEDPGGYPAWVPKNHLGPRSKAVARPGRTSAPLDAVEIAYLARRHLGLPYLWGGTSPYGLDCSGLVHLSYRQAGVVVPRDADPQHAACREVPLGEERPGDLYFFAQPGEEVTHVGFVTGRQTILHASETEGRVVEMLLSPERLATVSRAGRLLS